MSSTPGYGWAKQGVFQLGKGKTLAIPMEVHASSRAKLVELLKSKGQSKGLVLLQGGDEQCQYDSDTELVFRQDSWFNYLFGVKEPGMYGSINIETGKTTLFIPRLDDEYKVWCGEIHSADTFKNSYAVDEVCYTDEMPTWVDGAMKADGAMKLYILDGVNSDSGLNAKNASYPGISAYYDTNRVDKGALHHALSTARVTKSTAEIEVMRYCAWVASNAHVEVMRQAAAGMIEYELEAIFAYEIYRRGGCRKCAYTAICGCGPDGATLHYGHAGAPNDRVIQSSDMCLLDMGAEYHGYVSDITCSFPIGRFTEDQRAIFTGVLNAQIAVAELMAPGVSWVDCHLAADREIVKALVSVGVLGNGTVEEMCAARMGAVFMPHGLGHLIGCDTHDVGGYIDGTPKKSEHPGIGKLRTSRLMEEGMVMTSEPGCYFIDALLDRALANPDQAKFMNASVIDRFRGFGGVRLEDVVVVTADGVENLTTAPRTCDEVEAVRAGGAWPPMIDTCPVLKRKWMTLGPNGQGMVPLPVATA
jgi:Xaa-Pro dipeptidase